MVFPNCWGPSLGNFGIQNLENLKNEKISHAKPSQAKPSQTKPSQTKPNQAKPDVVCGASMPIGAFKGPMGSQYVIFGDFQTKKANLKNW